MSETRLQLWSVWLVTVAICAIGCSNSDGPERSSGASTETWATIRFDVSQSSTVTAAELLRPSITTDGIDDFDTYNTLGSFLNQNDERVGMVLYDGIGRV